MKFHTLFRNHHAHGITMKDLANMIVFFLLVWYFSLYICKIMVFVILSNDLVAPFYLVYDHMLTLFVGSETS